MALPASGMLNTFKEAGQVIVVPMGGVRLVQFQSIPAIGTEGLGSCSVVLIASSKGAILAHIPPRPSMDNTDPLAVET